MNEIKLEPGWLRRQMREVLAEVAKWPKSLQPLRTLNAELVRPAAKKPETAR